MNILVITSNNTFDIIIYVYSNTLFKTNKFISEEQLIAVCLDLFIAGSQTTSSTLDFAILAMARYPDVQAKLQSTLDEIQPPGKFITAEEILK